jgi:predicted nucleotidyltransferase
MINTIIKDIDVISKEQRLLISNRYKRVTQTINKEFWCSDSDTAHGFYVGSYGRGTAVDTSDIDILLELPKKEYQSHNDIRGNGQSRLLQAVRVAVLSTYPKSTVRADGQVVKIDFSDGIKFEILPAFKNLSTGI